MHTALNNAVCLNTVSYKYVILMYIRIHLYLYHAVWTCLLVSVCRAHYWKCMLLWWYVCWCWLLSWISFLAVPLSSWLLRPIEFCLLLWPPTRICLMLMKVSVAQIKPKAWKSVKQIAICFLSHAAWQEKETDSERRSEGWKESRHRHRTSSIAFCGRAHVYFIQHVQPYIYYILAQPYTVCCLCRAALSMILTCSLRSRLPAACWLPPSVRTVSVWFGSARFWFWLALVWFTFRYVFNLANATKQDSFSWYRGCAISAHFTINW